MEGGGGAGLVLVAAILFRTRPDAHADIAAPTDAAKPASAATALATAGGHFLCTIEPERSRITVSSTDDVPVDLGPGGCVNGRTQYARGSDGRWQRIRVPNDEATVKNASNNPKRRKYTVEP